MRKLEQAFQKKTIKKQLSQKLGLFLWMEHTLQVLVARSVRRKAVPPGSHPASSASARFGQLAVIQAYSRCIGHPLVSFLGDCELCRTRLQRKKNRRWRCKFECQLHSNVIVDALVFAHFSDLHVVFISGPYTRVNGGKKRKNKKKMSTFDWCCLPLTTHRYVKTRNPEQRRWHFERSFASQRCLLDHCVYLEWPILHIFSEACRQTFISHWSEDVNSHFFHSAGARDKWSQSPIKKTKMLYNTLYTGSWEIPTIQLLPESYTSKMKNCKSFCRKKNARFLPNQWLF